MKKYFFYLVFLILLSSCLNEEETVGDYVTCPNRNPESITLKSGVKIKRENNQFVYLDDILLTEDQVRLLDETGSIFHSNLTKENKPPFIEKGKPISPIYGTTAIPEKEETKAVGRSPQQGMFWAMVRFTLSDELKYYEKRQILDAIKYIESKTNARFYDATGKPTIDPTYGFEYPYIEFIPSNSNRSFIGRKGGKQVLELVDFWIRGTIVHEICHALGMFHEQSRADRDDYITIHYDNIVQGEEPNFRKETKNYYLLGDFDFNSIMLYGSDYFTKNGKPTITKKDGSTYTANREGLSEKDRSFINTFYLPYVAREDVCVELDTVVYNSNNERLSEAEIEQLERWLNQGRCGDSFN